MTTLHFAYTVFDQASYSAPGAWRELPIDQLRWPTPVHAPFSITYQVLSSMRRHYRTKLYEISERCTAELEQNDYFFGHMFPKSGSFGGEKMLPDLDTVGWKTLERFGRAKTCVIQPFVYCPEIVEMEWLSNAFGPWCENFVAICGEYWEKTWWNSPLSKNNRNFLRINMCIDPATYPWVRKSFRPKGQRRFLYIGHDRPYKNTAQLEAIAQRYPGFQGGCLCALKGWHRLSEHPIALTPDIMAQLAEHFDVFLSTSTGDAQATTILEQMASGFPVACTPSSGYERPSIIKLDPHDTDFNLHQIHLLQNMEDEQLMAMAKTNRQLVETEYSWDHEMQRLMLFVDGLVKGTAK
jgi:hypothetical protein